MARDVKLLRIVKGDKDEQDSSLKPGVNGPAASPEAALNELKKRGRLMSEKERNAYIRQAVCVVDEDLLAKRLLNIIRGDEDEDAFDEIEIKNNLTNLSA